MKKKKAKVRKPSKAEVSKIREVERILDQVQLLSRSLADSMKSAMNGARPKKFQQESLADCAEIRRWLNAIWCCDLRSAFKIQEDMDTATRDGLPSKLYDYVEKHAPGNHDS